MSKEDEYICRCCGSYHELGMEYCQICGTQLAPTTRTGKVINILFWGFVSVLCGIGLGVITGVIK